MSEKKQQSSGSGSGSSSNPKFLKPISKANTQLVPTQVIPIHNRFSPITPKRNSSYSNVVQTTPLPSQSFSPQRALCSLGTPIREIIQKIPEKSIIKPRALPQKTQSDHSQYILNPNTQVIKILEDHEIEKVSQSFFNLTDYLFPKGFNYIDSISKTREYYQTILIDTNSVKIDHNMNKREPSKIDFSKFRIKRILTAEEWGSKPFINKTLAGFPDHPFYNFYDYQEAWFKTLFLRGFSHSWFISFDQNFDLNYPRWFLRWFRFTGINLDILPKPIAEGFQKFKSIFIQDIPDFEYFLQFSVLFSVPWIMSWTFHYQPENGTLIPPTLLRHYRLKWWDKFPIKQADEQQVIKYYNDNYDVKIVDSQKEILLSPEDEFLNRIQKAATSLSTEEFKMLLDQYKGSSATSSTSQEYLPDSQDPYDDFDLLKD